MCAALPDCDPAAAYPGLAAIREALGHHDWASVRQHYRELPLESDRTIVCSEITQQSGIDEELRHLLEAGDDPLLLALLGTYEVATGWRGLEVRWNVPQGSAWHQISEPRVADFHHRLRTGEKLFFRAVELDPRCDIALAGLLRTSRGLSLGLAETRRRYDRLAECNPAHYSAQCRMLQQLCPKWGGSWSMAHQFVNDCLASAPAGALTGALAAELHIEHWKAEDTSYLRRTDVLRDLTEAAHCSVLHPDFRRTYPWVRAHGAFALAFSVSGDPHSAATHFAALENLMDSSPPWGYLTDAPQQYAKLRAAALSGVRLPL